jgi:hypothetical protein
LRIFDGAMAALGAQSSPSDENAALRSEPVHFEAMPEPGALSLLSLGVLSFASCGRWASRA